MVYSVPMTRDEFLQFVCENIRKARWLAGMTQEQVAEGRLNYKHFQDIENGRHEPTLTTLYMLAEVLGTTVSELTAVPGRTREPGAPCFAELDVSPPKRGRKPRK